MIEKYFSYKCDACKHELRFSETDPVPRGWAHFSWDDGKWDLCPQCADATMLWIVGIEERRRQAAGDNVPIHVLHLSVRSYNCLKRAGIDTIGKLEMTSISEMRQIRSLGKKGIEEIREKLKEYRRAENDEQIKTGL